VSKAFTKDDDDAGFEEPKSTLAGVPARPFRLTATGAKRASAHADDRVREAAARGELLERVVAPERAALGVVVVTRNDDGAEKIYRLVSPEERALIGDGCSVEGPIGAALVGARVGDTVEITLPRGNEELEIVALRGED